ncbi:MAG TPA: SpoIIE family protein phosphatase [Vicinamibacterales bacterium]|nr:SpoIIE family protein phosphatase [Vicinamibacterales bacterium]
MAGFRVLLRTAAGRLFVAAAAVKMLLALAARAGPLPAALAIVDALATLGIAGALAYFTVRLAALVRRRLLWRVRRKLILSYIFIGVVPALLIVAFFVLSGLLLFMNLSTFLFREAYADVLEDLRAMAQASAAEAARERDVERAARVIFERRRANARAAYREVAFALVEVSGERPPNRTAGERARGATEPGTRDAASGAATADAQAASVDAARPAVVVGPWRHLAPPVAIPAWVVRRGGFAGTLALVSSEGTGDPLLVARAVALVEPRGAGRPTRAVVADLPVGDAVLRALEDRTGIRAGGVSLSRAEDTEAARPLLGRIGEAARRVGGRVGGGGFQGGGALDRSVGVLEFVDWATGRTGRAYVSLHITPRQLYERISAAQPVAGRGMSLGQIFLGALVFIAVLFVVIQLVALAMGVALARSITSSVHELFTGTERVRQGDFTHRIAVKARDQLGELATAFNQMTESIETLLQAEAAKKRMEEELRIAREIQMSLLPRGPLAVPGLEIAALCLPAREVGGDYYDCFRLGPRRVAFLVADVAGKGTSAALYMAELKGLLLSLSQRHESPRQLLIEVNRAISADLDPRSFITMTYAVVDLDAATLTYARAGHTPLLYLPASGEPRQARILQPAGLVLGLHVDGIAERFAALLEEQSLRIGPGDLFVFYTDGVTEAMNRDSELFGEVRLRQLVEQYGHLGSAELRERIVAEVEAFTGGAAQHDDLTLILVKVAGLGVEAPAEAPRAEAVGAVPREPQPAGARAVVG